MKRYGMTVIRHSYARMGGLGLTIAQTFIAQHNGAIECESVPGRTNFTVLLPLELNRTGA